MVCHLFLDSFCEIYDLLGCIQRLRVFKANFFVPRSSSIIIWDYDILFLNRRMIAEIWLCFRACNSRIVTCDLRKNFFVVWFCVLITVTESFLENFFLKEIMVLSKTCDLVFEIVSLKVFFWTRSTKSVFSNPILEERNCSRLWEKFCENFSVLERVALKTFPFWKLTFKVRLPHVGRLTFEFESLKNVKIA